MKLPYQEGDWFAVPLPSGGFASGIVARTTTRGRVLLGYFFGPRRPGPGTVDDLNDPSAERAILVARFGDMSLIRGEWPILGRSQDWERDEWPMPAFVNRDPLSGRAWRIEYADDDPNALINRTPIAVAETAGLEVDRVCGAGSIEMQLDQLLSNAESSEAGSQR
jgi:hypothetical protein